MAKLVPVDNDTSHLVLASGRRLIIWYDTISVGLSDDPIVLRTGMDYEVIQSEDEETVGELTDAEKLEVIDFLIDRLTKVRAALSK